MIRMPHLTFKWNISKSKDVKLSLGTTETNIEYHIGAGFSLISGDEKRIPLLGVQDGLIVKC